MIFFEKITSNEKPDFKPKVEKLEDGERFTIRIRRKPVSSRQVKSANEIFEQHNRQIAEGLEPASHRADIYDYKKMLTSVGSPESMEMPEPKLEIVMVRHLPHKDNSVSAEDVEAYQPKVEQLIDDLDITENSVVYLVPSSTKKFINTEEGIGVKSRTVDTVRAIAAVFEKKGINYIYDDIDSTKDRIGATTLRVKEGIREFGEDTEKFNQAMMKFQANLKARQEKRPLPYPDQAYDKHPSVYASEASDLKDLRDKTGIEEMSSATVARGLSAIDALEFYFLKENNVPKEVDKVVVILVGHGQFVTNISEALFEATDGNFPVILAGNGGYWRLKAGVDGQGDVVEEIQIETGQKTGMTKIR